MDAIWTATRNILAESLTDRNYKIWIDPLVPVTIEGQTLRLGCPNRFFMSWVRDNYYQLILDAVEQTQKMGAQEASIQDLQLIIATPSKERYSQESTTQRQYELPHVEIHRKAPLRFNPRFTFDRFIVGAGNQYAFQAAQALARGRELNTNSLFLLSDPGLGKSHLSQALGHKILNSDQRKKVYYLTAEDFTNEMVYSIKNHCVEDFKNKYRRSCDVLVIEEIHFLSGKEKIQAELTYTLDCLNEGNKKIVFTSSRLPRDIPRLGQQFVSRLSNCLISTIEPPDFDTRLRILKSKANDNGLDVPLHALEFMAQHLTKDVRKLESCLNSLAARSKLLHRPIELNLVKESLADFITQPTGVTAENIQRLVCHHFRVTTDELKSRSRRKNVVLPRNLGMYLCRKMTDLSLESIGKLFGRNHSTVLYSINLIENRCRRDPKLKGQIEFLTSQVKKELS